MIWYANLWETAKFNQIKFKIGTTYLKGRKNHLLATLRI